MNKELICSQCGNIIIESYLTKGAYIQCFDCYAQEEYDFENPNLNDYE